MKKLFILFLAAGGMAAATEKSSAQYNDTVEINQVVPVSKLISSEVFDLSAYMRKSGEYYTSVIHDYSLSRTNLFYSNGRLVRLLPPNQSESGSMITLNSGNIAGTGQSGSPYAHFNRFIYHGEPIMAPEKESVMNRKTSVYKIKPSVDIPIIAAGTSWSIFAFTKIYKKGPSTEEKILSLKKSNINAFDRGFIYTYSHSLDRNSYYLLYSAFPLPLILFSADGEMREDFWKLTVLYWEALSISGLLGTGTTYFIDRYRPYAYDPATPMKKRTAQNAKSSFNSGHVQVVALSTFFISKVFSDYHPDSNVKWVFYGAASLATGAQAYMRLRGGLHFPTDILYGGALGVLTGILVPQCHKTKNSPLTILPYSDEESRGLTFVYNFQDTRVKR